MFIVPPFFCPEADGWFDLLDAGPANAAATSIAAPSAAMAPESQIFFCIDLLSMTHETGRWPDSMVDASSTRKTSRAEFSWRMSKM